MRVISAWSLLEVTFEMIATRMMRADHRAMRGMMEAIKYSLARRDAVLAAIKAMLSEDDRRFLVALVKLVGPLQTFRHMLAHNVWAQSDKARDRIVLVEPSLLATRGLAGAEAAGALRKALASHPDKPLESAGRIRAANLIRGSEVEGITVTELENALAAVEPAMDALHFLEFLRDPEQANHARARLSELLQTHLAPPPCGS